MHVPISTPLLTLTLELQHRVKMSAPAGVSILDVTVDHTTREVLLRVGVGGGRVIEVRDPQAGFPSPELLCRLQLLSDP